MKRFLMPVLVLILFEGTTHAQDVTGGPLTMIPIYGQSLSTGHASLPIVDGSAAYRSTALRFNPGVRLISDLSDPNIMLDPSTLTSFLPLHESESAAGDDGETIASGMAFRLNDMTNGNFPVLVSSHGVGGQPYENLKRGTIPYNNLLAAVRRAVEMKGAILVSAVAYIQGESDFLDGTSETEFAADLVELQNDLNVDISAITGQSETVLLLTDQTCSYTSPAWGNQSSSTSAIPLAQLEASVQDPNILLVGPKYMIAYLPSDGVHLPAHSEEILGEYYAKAIEAAVIDSSGWQPLKPIAISEAGQFITLSFNRSIALDTSLVSNPGNDGFEYDDPSPQAPHIVSIASVQDSPDVLRITLSSPSNAQRGSRVLSYAWKGAVDQNAGPFSGPRGNVRDLDSSMSRLGDGTHLYNWCVQFRTAL